MNFYRINKRSCHWPNKSLRGTLSFQFTSIFLSTMKHCQHFLSSFWFLNHCSLVFSKLVAIAMNFFVTLNLSSPILTWSFLKLIENCRATSLSYPSNFCRNYRNINSHNSARVLRYSTIYSILLRDKGSFRKGVIAASGYGQSSFETLHGELVHVAAI